MQTHQRVVVKVGTAVVTHEDGSLALGRVHSLVEDLARLRHQGVRVMLVSSGAVGMGMQALGFKARPASMGLRQACAAVGQSKLMAVYEQAFGHKNVRVGQVLVTQDDLGDPDRALCLRTTLFRLLELGVVPILNENDSVSIRELIDIDNRAPVHFGDNDMLSAHVAVQLDASLLVILSNIDGVYDKDPSVDPRARRVDVIADEAPDVEFGESNKLGTGGMAAKIVAARFAQQGGVPAVIASGLMPGVLDAAIRGDAVGTRFVTGMVHKRPDGFARRACGAVMVNGGALAAIAANKASLLPVGIVAVTGTFGRGELVEVQDEHGRIRGFGLSNYDADSVRRIAGHKSEQILGILGWKSHNTVITRHNLKMAPSPMAQQGQ